MSKGTKVWSSGPWKRVRNTPTPFANGPDELVSATNIYLQDTVNGSGAFARWGYKVRNGGTALGDHSGGAQGGFIHTHTDATGTQYTFVLTGGKIYRVADGEDCTCTDVTPAAGAPGLRPYMLSFNGYLIIGGDDMQPWIATNLASTPITHTAIDIDGLGTGWYSRGFPVEYAGSVVFIWAESTSVTKIVWSAPGDPATGYEQNPYDFSWILLAAGSEPLNALQATNLALYYFRDHSIGALTGTPATAGSTSGSDFRNASTQDAISADVGCNAPATIQQYGNNIFFLDIDGRPWLLPMSGGVQSAGSILVPIWQAMQSLVHAQQSFFFKQGGAPALTRQYANASLVPELGLYLVGDFTYYSSGKLDAPKTLHMFDARTGTYGGEWFISSNFPIFAHGTIAQVGQFGATRHVLLATISAAEPPSTDTRGVYLWVTGTPTDPGWFDDDAHGVQTAIPITVATPRFGFDVSTVQNIDRVTVITEGILSAGTAPLSVTVTTPQDSVTVTPTPSSASTDGTFKAMAGVQAFGRGLTVSVSPQGLILGGQWSLQQIVAQGTECLAGPDDI